ncbi:DUF2924 domain-containing protein [Enterovirga sp. CN4-39]|uniref:DUF2924 domain-containing protein n=1 Tax=Enterovirga sp. CN4-39 TaxID=3400910 RepID=UPI003C0D369A
MSRAVTAVEAEVASLRDLDAVALRARWRALTGKPAPRHVSAALLLRMLAYRIQAEAFGDLSRESVRLLHRIGEGGAVPVPERQEKPGTVLVREWQGVRHHVMTLSEGFAWNGGTYGSLSEVALAITGTKWSGPRFFGLRQKENVKGPQDRSIAR